jgi:adenylosuccinate lyase
MPFKRNPIAAENVDSLGRLVAALPRVAWDNAAHSLLERTLDDSGNRRLVLPQAFLLSDELLRRAQSLVSGLVIHDDRVARNLEIYGTFAATERLLMELVKAGADRQRMHERIREHSLEAWAVLERTQRPESNPLPERLAGDPALRAFLEPSQIRALLDAGGYVGDAPQRARELAMRIREALGSTARADG